MDTIIDIAGAIGEPTRLRILVVLSRGEMAVGELSFVLCQSQPRVSRHLKLLAEAGLVVRRPEGAWVFFRLADSGVAARLARAFLAELPDSDFTLRADMERVGQLHAQRIAQAGAYFESVADEWETLRRLHQPEAAVRAAMAAAVAGRRFRMHLDLGTGTGDVLAGFAASADRGEGLDASRKMLALARSRLGDSALAHLGVRLGDMLSLPYPDGAADLITIHQVLHYLSDPKAALGEAARVLAPGGVMLIADFAPHDFEELRVRHAHVRLGFPPEELEAWCRAAGLDVGPARRIEPEAGKGGLAVLLWQASKPEGRGAAAAAAVAAGGSA